jgi:CelD/BcsL family acetyltransferase involved in cellulose biosynthesis
MFAGVRLREPECNVRQRTAQPAIHPAPFAPAQAPRSEIVVQFLTGADDFTRLAQHWNRLHEETPTASVFTSWVWQFQWWQLYGGERPLRLLVALEAGEPVGILPLYIHTIRVLGVPVRLLRFVGTGADTNPDDLGPVLAPVRESEIARQLSRAALRVAGVDVVVGSDIDPRSPFGRALEQAAADAGRACLAHAGERIAYVDLPENWSKFMQSLGSDRRTRLRGARRKAAAAHEVRFFVWSDAARLDEGIDRLVELHRRRWAAAGGSESFQSAEYVEFHRRIIKASFARGWLRLYCLELDGEIAAITYCYRFRNRVFLMQAGFDPAQARCNPGKVLLGHALEHAIGEGNTVFDFLRGEHRYKDQLATGHRTTNCVRVFRATPGALVYRLRRVWLPLLKARLYGRPAPKLKI